MKFIKKIMLTAVVFAVASGLTTNLKADEAFEDYSGYGYEQSYDSSNLAPTIALGTIAVIAIATVLAQSSSHHHHGHAHSH